MMLDSASTAKPARSKHGLRATAPVLSKSNPDANKGQVNKSTPASQKSRNGSAIAKPDKQSKVVNSKVNSAKKTKAA